MRAIVYVNTQQHTQIQLYNEPGGVRARVLVCYKTKRWTPSCLKALLGVSGALSRVMLLVHFGNKYAHNHTHYMHTHTVYTQACKYSLHFHTWQMLLMHAQTNLQGLCGGDTLTTEYYSSPITPHSSFVLSPCYQASYSIWQRGGKFAFD